MPRRSEGNVGETTTTGDFRIRELRNNLSSGSSASDTRLGAERRKRGRKSLSIRREHGSTDGGNVVTGGRVIGLDGLVATEAVDVLLGGSTGITTGDKDGNTEETDLLETNVGVLDIGVRSSSQLTTASSLTSDIALASLSPTVRNGENVGESLTESASLLDQGSEVIDPTNREIEINIKPILVCLEGHIPVNDEERSRNTRSHSHDVLNIQSRLCCVDAVRKGSFRTQTT